MQHNKSDIYKITRRLYYLLRHHADYIVFKKIRGACGYYLNDKSISINLDYRKEIIPTLIHEALHHWHPDWSETKVLNNERMIINNLSMRQIKNILRVLAENI
jgi:hypothetical protein